MKIIADEHISQHLVSAVNGCGMVTKGIEFVSIRDFPEFLASEDENWITSASRIGFKGVLSADRAMLRRPTMIEALKQLEYVAIYIPKDFANGNIEYQKSYIIYWWTEIQKTFNTAETGTIWMSPKGLAGGSVRRIV